MGLKLVKAGCCRMLYLACFLTVFLLSGPRIVGCLGKSPGETINRSHAHRTHRQRKHPRHRHTHARDKKKTPNEDLPQALNNAKDVIQRSDMAMFVCFGADLTYEDEVSEHGLALTKKKWLWGFWARINPPCIAPFHLHCPHYCNTIARRLPNIRRPFELFFVSGLSWHRVNPSSKRKEKKRKSC